MSAQDDGAGTEEARPLGAAARLTEDAGELLRQEVRAIREEAVAAVRGAGVGAGLLAGAGVCAALALASGHQTLLRALESAAVPRTRATAVLTMLYAASGGALAAYGLIRLRETALRSGSVVEHARQDVRAGRR